MQINASYSPCRLYISIPLGFERSVYSISTGPCGLVLLRVTPLCNLLPGILTGIKWIGVDPIARAITILMHLSICASTLNRAITLLVLFEDLRGDTAGAVYSIGRLAGGEAEMDDCRQNQAVPTIQCTAKRGPGCLFL